MSVFATAFDLFFNNASLSAPATYTAPGGSPVPCTICFSRDETGSDAGERNLTLHRRFDVRPSDVAAPVEDGLFVIYPDASSRTAGTNGTRYLVMHDPVLDELSIVWQILARKDGSTV